MVITNACMLIHTLMLEDRLSNIITMETALTLSDYYFGKRVALETTTCACMIQWQRVLVSIVVAARAPMLMTWWFFPWSSEALCCVNIVDIAMVIGHFGARHEDVHYWKELRPLPKSWAQAASLPSTCLPCWLMVSYQLVVRYTLLE